MLCVSTIKVLGFFGSTFPKTFRAIPGLKSLVSFESMVNCFTFPCGTPSTALRSGAGEGRGTGVIKPAHRRLRKSCLRIQKRENQKYRPWLGHEISSQVLVNSGSSPRPMLCLLDIRIERPSDEAHLGCTHQTESRPQFLDSVACSRHIDRGVSDRRAASTA